MKTKKKPGCLVAVIVVIAIIAVTNAINSTKKDSDNQQVNNNVDTSSLTSNNESSNNVINENTEIYYHIGDTITIDEWEVTLNSFDITDKITDESGFMSFKPDEGNKYLVLNATVKNLSTNRNDFLPSFSTSKDIRVKIQYKEYVFTSSGLMGNSDDLHMTSLNPLSSKTGIIAFNIANEAVESLSELKLVFSTNKENYTFLLE